MSSLYDVNKCKDGTQKAPAGPDYFAVNVIGSESAIVS